MPLLTKDTAGVSITFSNFRAEGNKAVYIGPVHSDIDKQEFRLSSVSPKTTANSYGNRRSEMSVIDTVKVDTPLGTQISRDMKASFSASIPVGATEAEFAELIANQVELLADPGFVKDLFFNGRVQH